LARTLDVVGGQLFNVVVANLQREESAVGLERGDGKNEVEEGRDGGNELGAPVLPLAGLVGMGGGRRCRYYRRITCLGGQSPGSLPISQTEETDPTPPSSQRPLPTSETKTPPTLTEQVVGAT